VIYARGQFSGANTGALAARLAKGPNESSIRAAVEALSGINNIGDYKHFLTLRIAKYSAYSEYTIIGNHCFYKR
jgi:spore germination cell wall hydrolase CwlJ-like protein